MIMYQPIQLTADEWQILDILQRDGRATREHLEEQTSPATFDDAHTKGLIYQEAHADTYAITLLGVKSYTAPLNSHHRQPRKP